MGVNDNVKLPQLSQRCVLDATMSNGWKLAVMTHIEKCLGTECSGHGLTGGIEQIADLRLDFVKDWLH
jgi:hypothetical protein